MGDIPGELTLIAEELVPHPRYTPLRYLARGTFGSVLLAEDRTCGVLVALKLLQRSQVAEARFCEAEILNQMRLRHPHVIALSEVFLTDSFVVLVLEYAAGGHLGRLVPAGCGLSEAQARWIFQQIVFALDYCHRMGVACRDIKLENILVQDSTATQPIVKLADFGLSTHCEGPVQYHGAVGTPIYIPPEVVACSIGGAPYEPKKSDVWSCGVLLFILLTGRSPFQRPKDATLLTRMQRIQALLRRIIRVDYEPVPGVSAECQDLLAGMLVADPHQRLSIQGVLRHPWCCQGMDVEAMLRCNDSIMVSSLANAPETEVVHEVHALLAEAAAVATPSHRAQAAEGGGGVQPVASRHKPAQRWSQHLAAALISTLAVDAGERSMPTCARSAPLLPLREFSYRPYRDPLGDGRPPLR